ncbi:hypothetical protein MDOR_24510 [Mycolicibacterium doricum]|uniref:Uncharacterized protein n=1 Tax=Mycolicibacterium doricum TaxID=126673 RepID=A0A7I7VUG5_9MYCO|nr:hypothetical protein [Mycolicibacterium doricum]MCV7267190.1 hypothetical protein [Mycolicibacterium doricum]BBZ08282.1 hypothetical protein MDOR_24510 [Mycolicibacterium doricum]
MSVASSASSPNQAEEYSRGPCAPAPAECFCQAVLRDHRGQRIDAQPPAWVGTRRLAAIANT